MKRKERLEQNRISARESRKRKKTMIEELQRTVINLSRENKELNDRNEVLRRQLIDIGSKYPNVVPLHAVMTGVPGANPVPAGATPGVAPGATAKFDQTTSGPATQPTTFPTFPMFPGMAQPNGVWPAPLANAVPVQSIAQQAP